MHQIRPGKMPARLPVARALVAGDVRDDAVMGVGLTDGNLAISYDNPR